LGSRSKNTDLSFLRTVAFCDQQKQKLEKSENLRDAGFKSDPVLSISKNIYQFSFVLDKNKMQLNDELSKKIESFSFLRSFFFRLSIFANSL